MKDTRIAIFTLTKDRFEYTKRSVEALESRTHIPYDHYVIDNGSADETIEYLKQMPGHIVKIVFNAENKGISIASNQALDVIGDRYDYIIKLDNDCEIVTDNWLQPIIELIEKLQRRIILSPFVKGIGWQQPPRYDYLNIDGHRVGLSKHVGGISVVAPAWVYKSYRFPTNEPLHGNQDVRFSSYAQMNLGLALGYVEDIIAEHMDDTPNQQSKYPEYFKQRQVERFSVYGEHPLITKVLKRIRTLQFVRATYKAGITDQPVHLFLIDKIAKALSKQKHQE